MRGAVLVAIAATIGNMLQGWDGSTIAGICHQCIIRCLFEIGIMLVLFSSRVSFLISHSGKQSSNSLKNNLCLIFHTFLI